MSQEQILMLGTYFVNSTKYPGTSLTHISMIIIIRIALATLLSFGHYNILIYGYKTIAENFLKNDFTIFDDTLKKKMITGGDGSVSKLGYCQFVCSYDTWHIDIGKKLQ